jgi:hypothetical protein
MYDFREEFMKRAYLGVLLAVLILIGCGKAFIREGAVSPYLGKYETKEELRGAIERGEAPWKDFVAAIKADIISFKDVSPEAVANYLEAFANEGMLGRIPSRYADNVEMIISLDVIFQDSENIAHNQKAYREYLKRERHLLIST